MRLFSEATRLASFGVVTTLLTLGVIGEYLARMHFRIMRKPTYVIAEIVPPRDEISDSP